MRTQCERCIVSAKGICVDCEARKFDLHPPRRSGDSLAALALALAALPRPPSLSPPVDRAALIPKRKREKRGRTPEEQAERRERKKKNKRRRARKGRRR